MSATTSGVSPAPVASRPDLEKRDKAVRAQHAAAKKHERRDRAVWRWAAIGFAGLSGWLGWQNSKLAPLVASRPVVYSTLQPNGEWISSDHYEEVPPAAKQTEDVQNALWTYVQARDCYGSQSFKRQAYIAQAMSDERVGRQVRAQFDMANNPMAPQKIYGEKGIVVECDLVDPPTPIGDDSNQYLLRFHRLEHDGRATAADVLAAPVYTVTTRFRTGIYPNVVDDKRRTWLDRTSFNAAGVQVVDYPGARPVNARPSGRITPGLDRPRPTPGTNAASTEPRS